MFTLIRFEVGQTLWFAWLRTQQFAKLRSESCFFPRAVETAATRIWDWTVLGNAPGGFPETPIHTHTLSFGIYAQGECVNALVGSHDTQS
jgi:hypothetical protein